MVAGSPAAKQLARTQKVLAGAATLPGPIDFEASIPPTRWAWVRRVTGQNLWLYYTFDDDTVIALLVVKSPPVPVVD